jgi:hypothetical protein
MWDAVYSLAKARKEKMVNISEHDFMTIALWAVQ